MLACRLMSCREKDSDIEFAQDAIDEYKVRELLGLLNEMLAPQ